MRRYLMAALWPAGMAAIAAATAVAARRASASRGQACRAAASDDLPGMPAGLAGDAVPAGTAAPGTGIRDILPGPAGSRQLPGWVPGVIRLSAFGCASGAISYGVMALLGPTVVNRGPGIDETIVDWMTSHQIGPWAAVVERLDKIGHTWTTWGGAGAAAVCLGTSWRHDRWLPP